MKNAFWQWVVGLLLTIVIALGGAFWAVSVYASEREADLRVLETRVNALEEAVLRISENVERIVSELSKFRADQAEFKGELKAELRNLRR